jgi:hypothetical protein
MGSGAFLVEACRYLGDALMESWRVYGGRPEIPADEDEVVFAMRLVTQRCLYGVDRNPVAVDLAKMSLWLATLAKDHALTFVDHALRHGDSLVGLSRKQIEAFQWAPTGAVLPGLDVREPIDKVFELRRRIREAGESVSDWERRDLWNEAQFELEKVRLVGDLVVAAYFASDKPREREAKRAEFANAVVSGQADQYRGWLEDRRHGDPPLAPFHWEVEFLEVFERERQGFDAFVGNPPFMGGSKISTNLGANYLDWLLFVHKEAHGNGDLVAHFFRRAFDLLKSEGTLGLIATNTISQGDTRVTGLRWICSHGGTIYAARRHVKWPGSASVIVSLVHVSKSTVIGAKRLDDTNVDRITAFLFHRGGNDNPHILEANTDRSFLGSKVYGQGFTFDDANRSVLASPISEMERLIARDPRNAERIFPYIGGDELNDHPRHAHRRYVINFGQMSLNEAEAWPDLIRIVRERVKPERDRLREDTGPGAHAKKWWWQYQHPRQPLYAAIEGLKRVLVIARVSNAFAFTFLPQRMVYNEKIVVLPFERGSAICALQCRVHEAWARFFGSSLGEGFMYATVDCFETFPFPDEWEIDASLETTGEIYNEFRAALMIKNNEGLTKTYNRFHDPAHDGSGVSGCHSSDVVRDIERLRELHAAMDRVVLDAYGWHDIPTDCEFLLDYEIDEEEWRNKKKPYRYRWPDDVRDEVLARLLELNARRAAEEARSGAAAETGRRTKKAKRGKQRKVGAEGLFA